MQRRPHVEQLVEGLLAAAAVATVAAVAAAAALATAAATAVDDRRPNLETPRPDSSRAAQASRHRTRVVEQRRTGHQRHLPQQEVDIGLAAHRRTLAASAVLVDHHRSAAAAAAATRAGATWLPAACRARERSGPSVGWLESSSRRGAAREWPAEATVCSAATERPTPHTRSRSTRPPRCAAAAVAHSRLAATHSSEPLAAGSQPLGRSMAAHRPSRRLAAAAAAVAPFSLTDCSASSTAGNDASTPSCQSRRSVCARARASHAAGSRGVAATASCSASMALSSTSPERIDGVASSEWAAVAWSSWSSFLSRVASPMARAWAII
eukprot:scaffold58216_cov63-Phaeocystis_antarctica.AAC.2